MGIFALGIAKVSGIAIGEGEVNGLKTELRVAWSFATCFREELDMALTQKQKQQLKIAERRRSRKPVPAAGFELSLSPLTVKPREKSRFTARCPRVLLALERCLQVAYGQDSRLDDNSVVQALACTIRGTQPESEPVASVVELLTSTAADIEVSEDDWRMASRVIYTSVCTHNNGQPGCRNYQSYAASFLASARQLGTRQLGTQPTNG
jgi:hypothetical protein